MPSTWPACVSDESSASAGDAEVADGEAAAVVEQEVRGLDVAVDDALAVRVVERGGGLLEPRERAACAGPARPPRSRSATLPPVKSSMTMNGTPSCSPTS